MRTGISMGTGINIGTGINMRTGINMGSGLACIENSPFHDCSNKLEIKSSKHVEKGTKKRENYPQLCVNFRDKFWGLIWMSPVLCTCRGLRSQW